MRRTQTIILTLLIVVILSISLYVEASTLQGTIGSFFVTILELRLTLVSIIWLIVGLVIGYFIGLVESAIKHSKEEK